MFALSLMRGSTRHGFGPQSNHIFCRMCGSLTFFGITVRFAVVQFDIDVEIHVTIPNNLSLGNNSLQHLKRYGPWQKKVVAS